MTNTSLILTEIEKNKFKEWLFKKLWPSVTVDKAFIITLCEIEEIWYSVPQPSSLNEKFEEAISVFSEQMGKSKPITVDNLTKAILNLEGKAARNKDNT